MRKGEFKVKFDLLRVFTVQPSFLTTPVDRARQNSSGFET
jgi:hypothetical protein